MEGETIGVPARGDVMQTGFGVWRASGFGSNHLRVYLILIRPPRISQGSEAAGPVGWRAAKHLGSARGVVPWEVAPFEIKTWEKEC